MRDTVNPDVLFLFCGGSIDHQLDPIAEKLRPSAVSMLPAFLDKINLASGYDYKTVCNLNSQDVGKSHIDTIVNNIKSENESGRKAGIVITCGLKKIIQIARDIEDALMLAELADKKRIIITGSNYPIDYMQGNEPGDAGYNLGHAYFAASDEELPNGVHISQNGRLFTTQNIQQIRVDNSIKFIEPGYEGDYTYSLLQVGGTVASVYSPSRDQNIVSEVSPLEPALQKWLSSDIAIDGGVIAALDSREVTNPHREDLKNHIIGEYREGKRKFIIPHGTFTLTETAEYLEKHGIMKKCPDASISVMGSFYPLSGFALGDASFCLGGAVYAAQRKKPGVWIPMSGRIYAVGDVVKNVEYAQFVPKSATGAAPN